MAYTSLFFGGMLVVYTLLLVAIVSYIKREEFSEALSLSVMLFLLSGVMIVTVVS